MTGVLIVTTITYDGLGALLQLIPERVKQIVAKAADDVEANAKAVVPVDTGNLKSSIQTTFEDAGAVAYVGPRSVDYAIHVEYGTVKMRAQPYMRPAAERVRPAFVAAMKQVANKP